MKYFYYSLLLFCFSIHFIQAQSSGLLDFVNDTTIIKLPNDYSRVITDTFVIDQRIQTGNLLSITQRSKWLVIPVDHYLLFEKPLSRIMDDHLKDSINIPQGYKLVIDNLTYWNNSSPLFNSGMFLNGYTRLVYQSGKTIRDWQWEIKDPDEEENESKRIGLLVHNWMEKQKKALLQNNPLQPVSPFKYRRQIVTWLDAIYLTDGFILNGHLSLDFPADQMEKYTRGSAGIYYRKSSYHQSIAISGLDQQWYRRLNSSFVSRTNITGRMGFNNFNENKFTHVDWWNIFMFNASLTQSIEYRSLYLKGAFTGVGLHLNINVLPEIIEQIELGLLFTIGVYLP